jgi:hypothetical protein
MGSARGEAPVWLAALPMNRSTGVYRATFSREMIIAPSIP